MSVTKVSSAMQDLTDDYAFTGTVTGTNGKVVQVVNTQTGAVATGTTVIPIDDTIPQKTEGDQYMTLAITPTNASNKLQIDVVVIMSNNQTSSSNQVALFQDAVANAIASSDTAKAGGSAIVTQHFTHYMTAGTTSATTFKVRAGGDQAGTTTFNGHSGGRIHGGTFTSSITITEISV